jgi:tRNA A37 threonylcarbamoyladenosine dehydratase
MGTGNKLDPGAFRVEDVEKTSVCPLARVMRRELKKRGLTVKAVYSTEPPRPSRDGQPGPGSISFVPAAAGLVMAGEIIRSLIGAGAPSCGAWQYRL